MIINNKSQVIAKSFNDADSRNTTTENVGELIKLKAMNHKNSQYKLRIGLKNKFKRFDPKEMGR